jgi:hypothetical protein
MANYSIKYQTVRGKVTMGTTGTMVSANSTSEARQKFLSTHISIGNTKYKIISIVKMG